jgi:hypothetical protein
MQGHILSTGGDALRTPKKLPSYETLAKKTLPKCETKTQKFTNEERLLKTLSPKVREKKEEKKPDISTFGFQYV